MLIYNDIYEWEGWGGKLRLASGKCRLWVFDRRQAGMEKRVTVLRPKVVVVSDVADSKMSVRSCAGHIATRVIQDFSIDFNRMLYVEYYPPVRYGMRNEYEIPEQYVAVDFVWDQGRAIHPKWRHLQPPLLNVVKDLINSAQQQSPEYT
ncbi:MAG: hypothetical protein KFF46_10265 [Desulfobacterales bacterium]|nr:hypothetical protein [Desulfobacterales bacterium]